MNNTRTNAHTSACAVDAAYLSLSLWGKVVLLRNVHQSDEVAWQRGPDMTWFKGEENTKQTSQQHNPYTWTSVVWLSSNTAAFVAAEWISTDYNVSHHIKANLWGGTLNG